MYKKIIAHFKKADPKFYKILEKVYAIHGDKIFELTKKELLFDELVESIASQQLSVKASDAIYKRIIDLMPGKILNPVNLLKIKDEHLRSAGLSFGKIKYLKDLSKKVKSKELDLGSLEKLDNEEVIQELTKVKGIGRWTAEMFLMFALGRPDVFSHGDLGLKNAIKKIYGLKVYKIEEVEKIVIKWTPFRTFAARILWRSLEFK
jgi:DNA-3-methyladenine glycosylase II